MGQGIVATPFLERESFFKDEAAPPETEHYASSRASPFISIYELEGQPSYLSSEEEAYSTLVQELYDSEFDEALFGLVSSARGVRQENFFGNGTERHSEQVLLQHFSRLVQEAEATVGAFEKEFGNRSIATLTSQEIDTFANNYTPANSLEPEFEEFLGKWAKKIAKGVTGVVKKAGQFAVTMGLGPILSKIKALVKPLLDRVLQKAIGRLPEALRPVAQQLAQRVFGRSATAGSTDTPSTGSSPEAAAADATADPAVQESAGDSVTEIQQELDQQLANLLLSNEAAELDFEVARVRTDAYAPSVPVFSELDQAREKFVDGIESLREGEDPAPLIQNFLPAVLPALRIGVKLIGRPRVVHLLAGLLGKLIAKLVGPEHAPALSRAIVDAGLGLLSLEANDQDRTRSAASSVAAVVEETARRVSTLPAYVLDDQELLEGFALEAFEQAAAANLPPILSESTYRQRPELVEAFNGKSCWMMMPLRYPKFKKYGRTFKVRVTPYMAEEIDSFEGQLSDHFQDQYGIEEGNEIEAELELFETMPGSVNGCEEPRKYGYQGAVL